ncbi:luciferase domain-containing protein [Haloarcula laminariae]|uniref:luciferase domain-containing protein n=1 Tax=Haloarcula laminariae TaxID=2961577 RepID=UPI0021C7AEB0|nr:MULTISPECIES: luciferase family protein [Halomicroarcula]
MTTDRAAIAATVDRLIDEVSGWPHVTTGEHRFGGTEFRVGPREIGHVHGWGMLDIAYLKRLRDVLVDARETGSHHLLTESGWTTEYIESPEEYDHARWLLRLSYLYHVNVLQKTPAGAEEFADVDVESELAAMALTDDIRAAFDRR